LDSITLPIRSPWPTKAFVALVLQFAANGRDDRGRHHVTIAATRPSGGRHEYDRRLTFAFSRTRLTWGVGVPLHIDVEETGVFWFDVLVDGVTLSRVPLTIVDG